MLLVGCVAKMREINIDNLIKYFNETEENVCKKEYLSYDEKNIIQVILNNKLSELIFLKNTLTKVGINNEIEQTTKKN